MEMPAPWSCEKQRRFFFRLFRSHFIFAWQLDNLNALRKSNSNYSFQSQIQNEIISLNANVIATMGFIRLKLHVDSFNFSN